MCSDGVANAFQKVYPFVGLLTAAWCLYVVSMFPPLHAELYSTTVRPINGTLQVIQCDNKIKIALPDGSVVSHCERVVDQPAR